MSLKPLVRIRQLHLQVALHFLSHFRGNLRRFLVDLGRERVLAGFPLLLAKVEDGVALVYGTTLNQLQRALDKLHLVQRFAEVVHFEQ